MNGTSLLAFTSAAFAVLLAKAVWLHIRTIRSHGREALERHADVARAMSLDVSDKRRAWMLARIAKGEAFAAILAEKWEPLP